MPDCLPIGGLLGDIFKINFASISTKGINGETVSYRMEKKQPFINESSKEEINRISHCIIS